MGKYFKKILHRGKQLTKKAISEGVKASNFIGKTIDNAQDAYAQGRKFIKHTAVKADHALGTNGAISDLASAGISVFEQNPLAQEFNNSLNLVEKTNRRIRKDVLQNKDLNKFIGT